MLCNCQLVKVKILTMILLLGGPPRVGKSIISGRLRQKYALSVVSTDTLGAVLENVLSPETTPDLFVFDKFNAKPMAEQVKLIREDPPAIIEYVRKESFVVWKAVEFFARKENIEGREVLIEGVAILPELISQIQDIPYRVVFIGNQGENHEENIKKSIEENKHEWMREASEAYIRAFAIFVNQMSAYIEQETKKYGFEYIEINKKPFELVTEEVIQALGLAA